MGFFDGKSENTKKATELKTKGTFFSAPGDSSKPKGTFFSAGNQPDRLPEKVKKPTLGSKVWKGTKAVAKSVGKTAVFVPQRVAELAAVALGATDEDIRAGTQEAYGPLASKIQADSTLKESVAESAKLPFLAVGGGAKGVNFLATKFFGTKKITQANLESAKFKAYVASFSGAGGAFGAAESVSQGNDFFSAETAKSAGIGTLGGAALRPLGGVAMNVFGKSATQKASKELSAFRTSNPGATNVDDVPAYVASSIKAREDAVIAGKQAVKDKLVAAKEEFRSSQLPVVGKPVEPVIQLPSESVAAGQRALAETNIPKPVEPVLTPVEQTAKQYNSKADFISSQTLQDGVDTLRKADTVPGITKANHPVTLTAKQLEKKKAELGKTWERMHPNKQENAFIKKNPNQPELAAKIIADSKPQVAQPIAPVVPAQQAVPQYPVSAGTPTSVASTAQAIPQVDPVKVAAQTVDDIKTIQQEIPQNTYTPGTEKIWVENFNKDLTLSKEIAMGRALPPDNTPRTVYWSLMAKRAADIGDMNLIDDLRNSPVRNDLVSKSAAELRATQLAGKDNIVTVMDKIEKGKLEQLSKRVQDLIKKENAEALAEVLKKPSNVPGSHVAINRILDIIKCK